MVSLEQDDQLPGDYIASGPQTKARFAFFTGEQNLCFLPESQVKTYNYFNRLESGRHALVDGIPYVMPINCMDSPTLFA